MFSENRKSPLKNLPVIPAFQFSFHH
uniref:Uncharacterized protein n=1 Tax=Anguilla anguilla TaxID=7936 RepID=A0A0E9XRI1_ANGAN